MVGCHPPRLYLYRHLHFHCFTEPDITVVQPDKPKEIAIIDPFADVNYFGKELLKLDELIQAIKLNRISQCIFCNLIAIQPHKLLFENERIVAFYDKNQRPKHILVCPKRCIKHCLRLQAGDYDLVKEMKDVCEKVLSQIAPG